MEPIETSDFACDLELARQFFPIYDQICDQGHTYESLKEQVERGEEVNFGYSNQQMREMIRNWDVYFDDIERILTKRKQNRRLEREHADQSAL